MDANEKASLIGALQQGVVTVTFQKIGSDEVRVMPCTLNPSILEANGCTITVDGQKPETEHIVAWSLDKDAWRSFRANTVMSWEVLGE